jgi:hypothetical protein
VQALFSPTLHTGLFTYKDWLSSQSGGAVTYMSRLHTMTTRLEAVTLASPRPQCSNVLISTTVSSVCHTAQCKHDSIIFIVRKFHRYLDFRLLSPRTTTTSHGIRKSVPFRSPPNSVVKSVTHDKRPRRALTSLSSFLGLL